jgi:hypothetical protein
LFSSRTDRGTVVHNLLSFVVVPPTGARNLRFEPTGTVGGAQSAVVLDEPVYQVRTPPSFVETDQRHSLVFTGVDARVYWTKRLSVLAQISWGNNPSAVVSLQRPTPQPSIFADYVAQETVERRARMLSILQSVDLVAEGRLRPWVGGGVAFVHAVDSYEFVNVAFADPSIRSESTQEVDRSGYAALFTGGIKVLVTTSVLVSGDESGRAFFNDRPVGSFDAIWRVGVGIRF